MSWLDRTWQAVEENLRWADLVDIGLVAIFLYFVLSWLWARSSRGILAGGLIVGACYTLADWWDLYLTRFLFQAGFVFLLLAIIVVLQGDIRRGFEKLASLKFKRRPVDASGPKLNALRDLLRTVKQMSDDHIGALIVFPGREPIDRFTHGGIPVDGRISPALVYSIFSPNSPGHDGAIIVRDSRVEQIGLHLPLSKNLQAIGPGGTRHAAALGLAERCDALVLVVSEERGTISVALDGDIRAIATEDLEPLLIQFHRNRDSVAVRAPHKRTFSQRLPLKVASLLVAIILWSVFAFRVDSVRRNYVIPIEFRNLPSHLVIADPPAAYARLLVSATERVMADVDVDSLVVSFDLAAVEPGDTLRLETVDGIRGLPGELDILEVEPEELVLRISARGEAVAEPEENPQPELNREPAVTEPVPDPAPETMPAPAITS